MASYVVTGASRGLGYEFIRQLSSNSANTVIGLVRNKAATEDRIAKDGIKNITILEADITNFDAQKAAAAKVSELTGGSLDYLINNAAYVSELSGLKSLADFENDPPAVEKDLLDSFDINVVGVTKTVAAFLPLIKKSKIKKVITISTGMADLDLVNQFSVGMAAPYSISKAAVNLLIAKYNAAYASQGILFMSISPGLVDTNEGKSPSEEELKLLMPMLEAFKKYQPSFTGPISPSESVQAVMRVAEAATVEKYGGSFVSHHGNKTWL